MLGLDGEGQGERAGYEGEAANGGEEYEGGEGGDNDDHNNNNNNNNSNHVLELRGSDIRGTWQPSAASLASGEGRKKPVSTKQCQHGDRE
jgi:hypothetical protein